MTKSIASRGACAAFFALLAAFALDAWAQSVGRVEFVTGGVRIERANQTLIVLRGTAVIEGDTIVADPSGQVQLRMVDDAFLAVRPGTRLRLDQYRFNRADGNDGVVLNLIQGVLRTFTGQLALRARDRFRMKTSIATVGIRGSGNILAHYPDEGTVNHTITGSHSVTSLDAQGVEQTLVSLPGQTIQVLPGGIPRFVPTPAYILAAASNAPAKATAVAAAPASRDSSAATSSSSSSSTTSQDSSASSGAPTSSSGDSTARASSDTSTTSTPAPSDATATATPSTSTSAPPTDSTSASSSTANVAVTSPTLATPTTALQASNQTNYRTVGMNSGPGVDNGVSLYVLGSLPYSGGGRVGVLAYDIETGSATPTLDANGFLSAVAPLTFTNFVDGPAQFPSGYPVGDLQSASLRITGGTNAETFRNVEQNILLGRIEGATLSASGLNCSCGSMETREGSTGAASVNYVVFSPTPLGIIHSLTGLTQFRLDGATRPTDASGRLGTLNSATMNANFTNFVLDFTFNLSVNNLVYDASGSGLFFDRITFHGDNSGGYLPTGATMQVTCTGSGCAPTYRINVDGAFAGNQATNVWMTYRINPDRADNTAFSDVVSGSMAFVARTVPLQGIVLPATGTMRLTLYDNYFGTGYQTNNYYPTFTTNAFADADFTNRRGSFSFTFTRVLSASDIAAGFQPQTVTVTTADRPIIGNLFIGQTATLAQRNSLTVTCTGCGSAPPVGRFEAYFSYVAPNRIDANLGVYWQIGNNTVGTLGYDYYGSTGFIGSLTPGSGASSATPASAPTLRDSPRLVELGDRLISSIGLRGRVR